MSIVSSANTPERTNMSIVQSKESIPQSEETKEKGPLAMLY